MLTKGPITLAQKDSHCWRVYYSVGASPGTKNGKVNVPVAIQVRRDDRAGERGRSEGILELKGAITLTEENGKLSPV